MSNHRALLNELLQDVLRQNILLCCTFDSNEKKEFCAKLKIGVKEFNGDWGFSKNSAAENAAVKAYDELHKKCETEMRNFLGLEPRNCVDEIDDIRDSFRKIRKRISFSGDSVEHRNIKKMIGRLYARIDEIEGALIDIGIVDNTN